MFLLESVSADTNGTGVKCSGRAYTVAIWGTDFGSGSVTLQASPDGGTTWITLTIGGSPATFTANAVRVIDHLGAGILVRAILSGSTSPDSVNVAVF